MKRILTIAIVLSLALSTKAQTIPSWKITDVVNYYSQKTDSVYIINFWATWCVPCVEELPYIQSITKKYAGKKVKLLLVSLDLASFFPAKIQSFAKKQNITADIVWLNETDADYFCNMIDKKWSGSIPATVIVNAATGYKQFYEQQFKEEEFEKELLKAITK
ncbi:MAG: TlpA disulfide reductase family protein [Bacteroidota bacterium]